MGGHQPVGRMIQIEGKPLEEHLCWTAGRFRTVEHIEEDTYSGPEQRIKTMFKSQPSMPVPMTATKIATGAANAARLTSSLFRSAMGSVLYAK